MNILGIVEKWGPRDSQECAWDHADATIKELPIDAFGFVPWWPRPDVTLFKLVV